MKSSSWCRGLILSLFAASACSWHGTTPFESQPDDPDEEFPTPSGPPIVQPQFGPTVVQKTPPPAISGGTLLQLADGNTMVAADPDRDMIWVVDIGARTKVAGVALNPGDEPGRLVEDAAHRVHVALRRGGAVVTLDPTAWTVASRRAVCSAPRGIAYDATSDQLHVACAGGELVSLPAAGGDPTRVVQVDRDLRDVLVRNGQLLVTRFHTAQLLVLDDKGVPVQRFAPAGAADEFDTANFTPGGAFRTIIDPSDGAVIMAHQRATDGTVPTSQPGGYGGGSPCQGSIVQGTVSMMNPEAPPVSGPSLTDLVLPVDVAVSSTGQIAAISAGNAHTPGAMRVVFASREDISFGSTGCSFSEGGDPTDLGEPVAVAFTSDDRAVVQSREPARLYFAGTTDVIELTDDSRADTGHAIFHSNSGAGLACASCHLEGGEDGRVWSFENSGPRRTQSIRGGILGTEPFHWDGDQKDFGALMGEVFQHRMSGPLLPTSELLAMQGWVNKIPAMPAITSADPASVARGDALFHDTEKAGCVSCHSGTTFTNNVSVDVGTGGTFQVPSLRGVAWRPPYIHDGRAETLFERFTPIGGGDAHGNTSSLTATDIADLIAYLETI